MKIAVMTDSTAYIPKELREKHQIHVVPLSVVFDDKSYREELDITTEQFYDKLRNANELPTTSQPAVGDFVTKLNELAKDYDAVISIHISGKLSGTIESVRSAAQLVDDIKVYAYDSEISCMPQGFYAIEASEMAKHNKSPEEIIERLDEIKDKVKAYFMVDDLTNLHKGGRLSGAQKLVGSLLKIKPILHIEDGRIVPFEKIRTRQKAIQRIMNMLEKDAKEGKVEKVVFIHGNNESSAVALQETFKHMFPEIETVISYFGPVIGTHVGENSIGASWY